MASSVSSVYISVIDDVINKVRDDFGSGGGGDPVLTELQALWETKMMQSGVISGGIERQPIQRPAPVHDLNVPYEDYETATAEMLFPPTPMQTPLPGTVDYNISTGPSDFSGGDEVDFKAGRPSPYMQPPSPWMSQRPLGVDVNVAYEEGREELDRRVSQTPTQDFFLMPSGKRKRDDPTSQFYSHLTHGAFFPQKRWERGHDNGVFSARVDLQVGTPSLGTPRPSKSEAVDDDEPPLNEDDDDDDEDLDEFEREEEEPQTQHLVLAQFEKVTRTKSRWKCTLKDGIMHINNRDILFNKIW